MSTAYNLQPVNQSRLNQECSVLLQIQYDLWAKTYNLQLIYEANFVQSKWDNLVDIYISFYQPHIFKKYLKT